MKSKPLTFQELAKVQAEILAKQRPVTIEEAREQVRRLKEMSKSKNKKTGRTNETKE